MGTGRRGKRSLVCAKRVSGTLAVNVIRITAVLSLGALAVFPVAAGPVVCSTTLEAPDPAASAMAPVEVTVCGPEERTAELIERRFFTWTAPYERGVDLVHQITDLFGLAVAGDNGNRVMGFGFPDQTVIWDSAAVGATTRALLEEQSPPLPLRTRDLNNGFGSSLAAEAINVDSVQVSSDFTPLQPLW